MFERGDVMTSSLGHVFLVCAVEAWRVTFTTGDDENASTSERVALVVYGVNGKSQRVYLGEEGHKKLAGQTDSFDFEARSGLGDIYKIRVGFGVLKEESCSWQLKSVSRELSAALTETVRTRVGGGDVT